jgi:hypothetical protein
MVVTDPKHHHATYDLCGDDYVDARQLAATIATISGRPVMAEQVPVAHALPVGGISGAPGTPPTEEDDWRRNAMGGLFDHYGRYGITGNPNVLGWLLGWLLGRLRGLRPPLPAMIGKQAPGDASDRSTCTRWATACRT